MRSLAEPHCTGRARQGHGRGLCQWGSQRWALAGKTYDWIVLHYYPGRRLVGGGPPLPAYAAQFSAMQAPPAEMTSGEEAVVWLEYRNDGTATWDLASTRVGTAQPRDRESAFFTDGNWLAKNRPTAVDHSNHGPGAVGRFSFVVTAPQVD